MKLIPKHLLQKPPANLSAIRAEETWSSSRTTVQMNLPSVLGMEWLKKRPWMRRRNSVSVTNVGTATHNAQQGVEMPRNSRNRYFRTKCACEPLSNKRKPNKYKRTEHGEPHSGGSEIH